MEFDKLEKKQLIDILKTCENAFLEIINFANDDSVADINKVDRCRCKAEWVLSRKMEHDELY